MDIIPACRAVRHPTLYTVSDTMHCSTDTSCMLQHGKHSRTSASSSSSSSTYKWVHRAPFHSRRHPDQGMVTHARTESWALGVCGVHLRLLRGTLTCSARLPEVRRLMHVVLHDRCARLFRLHRKADLPDLAHSGNSSLDLSWDQTQAGSGRILRPAFNK